MGHSHHDGHDHSHDAGHGHDDHQHGAHGHGHSASERRLIVALSLLGSFTFIEAIGGYFAHSIALIAESAHMLADCGSLVLAIAAIRVGRRPPDTRRTFGHRRYQPLAAFVNGLFLLLLTAWVVYEAVLRLMHQTAVNGQLMLVIAVIGGVANLAALVTLSGASSLNERGARAHVLSDLLGSAVASVAAILILTWGWTIADPLLSLLVSALIARSAWALTRESADVLLEGTPGGFDVQRIEAELVGHIPGLVGIHDVHAWSMTGERATVTLHATLSTGTQHSDVVRAIYTRLHERLNCEHVTVQIEHGNDCLTPTCR